MSSILASTVADVQRQINKTLRDDKYVVGVDVDVFVLYYDGEEVGRSIVRDTLVLDGIIHQDKNNLNLLDGE